MNIEIEFKIGDSVCYLSGLQICHTNVRKITFEWGYDDDRKIIVYELMDGAKVPKTDQKWGGIRLFKDKESLIDYLDKQ